MKGEFQNVSNLNLCIIGHRLRDICCVLILVFKLNGIFHVNEADTEIPFVSF